MKMNPLPLGGDISQSLLGEKKIEGEERRREGERKTWNEERS
jgi:hypothetical protein